MCGRSGGLRAYGSTRARRQALERISDPLQGLELRLSYSVKASADVGLLVPSMRAESCHQALYESMGLAGRAAAAELVSSPALPPLMTGKDVPGMPLRPA
jgi:hypothetical protein